MANQDFNYWIAQFAAAWGCIGDFVMFDVDNIVELHAEIDAMFDEIQVKPGFQNAANAHLAA